MPQQSQLLPPGQRPPPGFIEVEQLRRELAAMTQRAEAAEAKLAAIPWDELHAVHMRATNKNLHDWLTVTDWLSRNTPEQQGAQP